MVRKETEQDKPIIHLYNETKNSHNGTAEEIAATVHQELKKLDKPYSELEDFTGIRPIKVSLLPKNAFKLYKLKQQASGAEISHLKPPHLNPTQDMIDFLANADIKAVTEIKEKVEA